MKSPINRSNALSVTALGICLFTLVSVVLASNVFDQLDLLVDVRHEIVGRYVEVVDQEKMVESAVRAMVQSLDDPHTIFLTPEEIEPLDNHVQDRFTGIGAEITIDTKINRLKIVTPLEDSPAWQSGVMAGDIVLEIDGNSTEDFNIREAQKHLLGEEGTKVNIKIRHESGEEADITITRALINVKGVRGFRRDEKNQWIYMLHAEKGVGYVKIRQFTDRTAEELRTAVDELISENCRGLILDLRFNPGGLLSAAVEVADIFLVGGKTIVSVKGRKGKSKAETSTSAGTIEPIPIVVLANEASASAAEIVTGALTDNDRAQFVGMRTFGKGSVQTIRMLESGRGAMKITTAYYYLPSGRLIHRREDSEQWGVEPEDGFFVPMDYGKMHNIYLENKVLRQFQGSTVTPQWIEENLADLQLAAGLRAILGKLEDDQWPVIGESGGEILARESKRRRLLRQRDFFQNNLDAVKKELASLNEAEPEEAESSTSKGPESVGSNAPATEDAKEADVEPSSVQEND